MLTVLEAGHDDGTDWQQTVLSRLDRALAGVDAVEIGRERRLH
jgi:hypothetical protein